MDFIRNELFSVYVLNSDGRKKSADIRDAFDILLNSISEYIGKDYLNTREFSIVKTKLESSCFYAIKAMAINPLNQINE